MSSHLGTSVHAARLATGELARQGWARLASLVGGHVASFGDTCWQTDSKLSELLTRPDGRRYHPESIARARRQLRDAQIITSERVFMGGKLPTHAKWKTSSRGTTIKAFNWRAIEQKNPFSRRERRLKRQEQARVARESGELQPPRPRYVSAHAAVDPVHTPTALDPEIVRLAEQAQAAQQRWAALRIDAARATGTRPAPVPGHTQARERPPPD